MFLLRHSVTTDQPDKSVNDESVKDVNAVTEVIANAIGVSKDKVKPEANFYELGGNSTNAVTVVVNLKKAGFNKVRMSGLFIFYELQGLFLQRVS